MAVKRMRKLHRDIKRGLSRLGEAKVIAASGDGMPGSVRRIGRSRQWVSRGNVMTMKNRGTKHRVMFMETKILHMPE